MSNKNKLQRFAEMETFENVIQPSWDDVYEKEHDLKGRWAKSWFKNDLPIVLELGCGKGEYTVAQARRDKARSFLGVDIKGARMWVGAKKALAEGLTNVSFLRTRIEFIKYFFAADEIDEIWITFPDPQLKDRREKKRLTHPRFLEMYKRILKKDGTVHLKTDSQELHAYTLEVIADQGLQIIHQSKDIDTEMASFSTDLQEILQVKTFYEQSFRNEGKAITYVAFRL